MSQGSAPTYIPLLTPELSQRLKQHFENVLVDIIQRNRLSRYATESPALLAFRNYPEKPSGNDLSAAGVIAERFHSTVPLSDYDAYYPFIRKLLEQPCKQAEVENLLSTGYPSYVTFSSMTTGKSLKYYPRYGLPRSNPQQGSASDRCMFNCLVMHLGTRRTLLVENETGQPVAKVPVCTASAAMLRTLFNMGFDQDKGALGIKVPPLTSPIAVSFIDNYRSFILMHALFALAERRLETLYTAYGTMLIDLVTFMEEDWDKLLKSIETGTLPDFEGTEHVRPHLALYFSANPERAVELRSIAPMKGSQGWLTKIWPNFKEYTGIVSGPWSGTFSKVQSYFNSDVTLRSPGYVLSECWPGIAFSGINLYSLAGDDYYEFLPTSEVEISESETAECLIPACQVETGKTYEPVLTSKDGLWRYRLGDLIRIEGFESTNGFPIMSFIERRYPEMRMIDATLPAKVIIDAITSAAEDTIGRILEFTSYFDSRAKLPTVGYIVELDGDIGNNLGRNPSLARNQVLDVLKRQHENIQRNIDMNKMGLPTICIVEHGTFAECRHKRVESTGVSLTQVKIPVILNDEALLGWLLQRKVHEA
ncbi:GH3 auxin-responsive promoter [Phlebopus sp. FC_14]|nr:GH3 auxin-responsive promoter [Phlebopus sp. FC_14]